MHGTSLAPFAALATCAALAQTILAQREVAELDWKKHEVAVEYGAVRVGDHSLASLPVGGEWRMGMNTASQIRLTVPLVAGDRVAAPGWYRVRILRQGEKELQFVLDGAGFAIGNRNANMPFDGELVEPEGKPTKQLELEWKKPKNEKGRGATTLSVLFGPSRLDVDLTALDAKRHKSRSFTANAFAWPAQTINERAAADHATPIAAVTPKKKPKDGPEAFNLVLKGDTIRLVPQMTAPTDSFGFGAVVAPDSAHTFEGEVQWSDLDTKKPGDTLELVEFKASKKEIALRFVAGARTGAATIELKK